jgi:hypothetical protein
MEQLAHAWTQQDTELALACFTPDAVYIEPPDIQHYQGHEQLRPYFVALTPGMFMHFHHLWFDVLNQMGAGEYSFGMTGKVTADHGVVVTELRDGRIAFWREYRRQGPSAFSDFIATAGKTWQWHIGNYP